MTCNGLLSSGLYTGLAMHTWVILVWGCHTDIVSWLLALVHPVQL